MKHKYSHLLFDLDHTLWDFDSNCILTLKELYIEYNLQSKNINLDLFCSRFIQINTEVWHLYDQNKISKEALREYRFKKLLETFNIKDGSLSYELETNYLDRCPKKGILMPHALDILNHTKTNFQLCLITNGFQKTQEEKVNYSDLRKFNLQMFTSESTGFKKPNKEYFEAVLRELAIDRNKCLVIGDNPHTDIQGAKNAGIDCLWINSQSYKKTIQSTYYVKNLASAILLFS